VTSLLLFATTFRWWCRGTPSRPPAPPRPVNGGTCLAGPGCQPPWSPAKPQAARPPPPTGGAWARLPQRPWYAAFSPGRATFADKPRLTQRLRQPRSRLNRWRRWPRRLRIRNDAPRLSFESAPVATRPRQTRTNGAGRGRRNPPGPPKPGLAWPAQPPRSRERRDYTLRANARERAWIPLTGLAPWSAASGCLRRGPGNGCPGQACPLGGVVPLSGLSATLPHLNSTLADLHLPPRSPHAAAPTPSPPPRGHPGLFT